jgi:hypothetical protein
MSDQLPSTSLPLSAKLAKSIPDGFFSPLSSRLAPVYIDCASRLELAAGEAARLELGEARHLIADIVSSHPEFDWPDNFAEADIRVRASKILNYLLEVHWLEDRAESLHERWVILSPALRPLLIMLRELASDSIGEISSFADTLAGICGTLETGGALIAEQPAESLRSTINDLNRRLAYAISQLHSVEKIVHGFEQRQMRTRTGAETLRLFYDDFYEGSHMVCHELLHRRGLLSRLYQARETVRVAAQDPLVKEKLASAFAVEHRRSEQDNWQLASEELSRLRRGLTGIRQRADAVDARIASFLQLSRQRFYYQSQMRGRRPEMARQLCELINRRFAGRRFVDLDAQEYALVTAPWRGLQAAEVEVLYGTSSLRMPRRARQPVSLELSDASLAPPDDAERARLREQMRAVLTPVRAARVVCQLLDAPNTSACTDEMKLPNEESFLDLIAAVSFSHTFTSGGMVRWQVQSAHDPQDWERKNVPRDEVAGWEVERFTLTRTQ